jgi:nitrogenase subunit NifH
MSTPGLAQFSAIVRNERRRRYENILVELKRTKDVASTICSVLPIIQSIEVCSVLGKAVLRLTPKQSTEDPLVAFSQNADRLLVAITDQMRIGEILGDIKPIVEDLFE